MMTWNVFEIMKEVHIMSFNTLQKAKVLLNQFKYDLLAPNPLLHLTKKNEIFFIMYFRLLCVFKEKANSGERPVDHMSLEPLYLLSKKNPTASLREELSFSNTCFKKLLYIYFFHALPKFYANFSNAYRETL